MLFLLRNCSNDPLQMNVYQVFYTQNIAAGHLAALDLQTQGAKESLLASRQDRDYKAPADLTICRSSWATLMKRAIGPRILAAMLSDFQMSHPMVSMVLHDVTPPAIADLLLTGGLDAVFCARHGPAHPRLRYVNLFEEPMVVAFPAGHEFSNLQSVPMAELVKQPYVERLHCEFRQETLDFSHECELELNVVFRSEREDWIQTMVHDGVGVSVIPQFSLLEPELDHRPVVEPAMSRTVELAMVSDTELSPALEKLIEEATVYTWPEAE
jgi:LysR family hydrogen peroxide-inducible transcriptional activator